MVGLGAVAGRGSTAKTVDIVVAFDDVKPQLAAAVRKEFFALYAAPGSQSVREDARPHSRQVQSVRVPGHPRSQPIARFRDQPGTRVFAHIPGAPQKVPVEPLYSAMAARSATGLCYTIRRLPRRRTIEEKKYGPVSDYAGTDVFLSLGERSDPDELLRVAELSVEALCTNRHLAEHLPVGESGADFRFLDDVELDVRCIAGPTAAARAAHDRARGQEGRTLRPARSPGASSAC